MKKLLEKIQTLLTAAAFAEEGEVEMARSVLAEAGDGAAPAADREAPSARPEPQQPRSRRRRVVERIRKV